MYEYKAIVVSIYDADTIRVDIDLGFGVWLKKQYLRFAHIDAWEIRGEEREKGLAAKYFLEEIMPVGSEILLLSLKDTSGVDKKGKYGRWIGNIWFNEQWINSMLVENGHAEWKEY